MVLSGPTRFGSTDDLIPEDHVPTLIVLNKLKSGADREAYETWAAEVDKPGVTGAFASVEDWHLYRAVANLGGPELPFDYIEVVSVNDAEQLAKDVQSDTAADLSRQLAEFCEAPTFVLTDQVV